MPIYEEKLLSRNKCVLILAAAFFLIYFPFQIGERELRWEEGYYAAMAMEMNFAKPNTVVHGEVISSSYPLFPWIAALIYRVGAGIEFSLRIVSVLSVFIICMIAWEAGKKALDTKAAAVACAAIFSSMVVVEKSIDGYPDMLGNLCVFVAWMIWFTYGPVRGQWNRAWLYSFFFCGLSFYTVGWEGVFFFCLPLLFMRRPMTIWSRLRKPGFFAGLVILAVFMLIWGLPRWLKGADIPFSNIPFKADDYSDFLVHLIFFPIQFFMRFFPWCLFAWPAFCAAYTPLDKNPVFSRFLKIIVITIFFYLWIDPFTKPRDFIILAAPLALLSGMNYWLLARRLGYQFHAFFRYMTYAGIAMSGLIILFYVIPPQWWTDIVTLTKGLSFRDEHSLIGMIQAFTALVILAYVARKIPRIELWLHVLAVSTAAALLYWSIIAPYQAQEQRQRKIAAEIILRMGGDYSVSRTVYKEPGVGLYGIGAYMKCNFRKINSVKDLPADAQTVYLISMDVPVLPERHWDKVTTQEYKDNNYIVWKGTLANSEK